VALVLQPDPDPDGIASALALRQVLRRNRATAPIVTFGGVTRPENVAMLKLLEIDLEVIRAEDLPRFERVALLDVQPERAQGRDRFSGRRDRPSPEQKGYSARFRDIRSVLRRDLDHPDGVLAWPRRS
jgi:nanoRNase/pAp phosphatase (c-di-AMP/oligoRNAs hydrolase)